MKPALLYLSSLLLALPACKKEAAPAADPGAEAPGLQAPEQPKELPPVPDESDKLASPGEADAAAFAEASNALAMDLYRVNRETPGNLVFSPASISMAFAMTYAGAAGSTAAEMQKVLHLPEGAGMHDSFGLLLKEWTPEGAAYELKLVNRLFGERSYPFEKPFVDLVASSYGAPLEDLDFKGAPDPQREHINSWVAQQTEERIKELLPPDSISKDTRLVLVNAIYFLGTWATPFEVSATTPLPFLIDGKKKAELPTMFQLDYQLYAELDGLKILELGYKDSPLAMTLVLPNKADGLAELEKQLDSKTFQSWLAALQTTRVSVKLPRFELKNARIPLVDSLKTLGMKLAFERGVADFTTMANPPDADDRLFISAAFHEAFVKVDETGTEAAAATAVVMARAGGMPAPPKEFHADHPFLFAIHDKKTGAILFLGRVVDPS